NNTIITRDSGKTSQANEMSGFTSEQSERLHKQGLLELVKMSRLHCITPWQGRKPSVLSEELLPPREGIFDDFRNE
ncbi:MAG: hypothetical protein IJZ19_02785, partial [Lentisphaeria bacterium]|nr:hypothetical protein [Lentisphaeria bacterium]